MIGEVEAEGVLTAPATTVTGEVAEGVVTGEVVEGAVTTTALSVGEKVETSPAPALTPGTPLPKSVEDIAASDPEEGELEVYPAKRQKLHKEIRILGQQLQETTQSLNNVTSTLGEVTTYLRTHSDELGRMAADLGYVGISQKYFLASLTAYQSELKKLSWQIEGSGKQHINTSMKSAVLAIGSKLMDGIAQIKEWRDDEKVRHRELLAAISAVEIACTNAPPNMGAPAPSTFGAHPPESPGPVGDVYQTAQMGAMPAAPPSTPSGIRMPGYAASAAVAPPASPPPAKQAWLVRVQTGSGIQTRNSPRRSGKQCLVLRTQFGNSRN